jgi:hypothetical protein
LDIANSLAISQFSSCRAICVCLLTYELPFPLEDCSVFGNFVIILIDNPTYIPMTPTKEDILDNQK